MPIITHAFDLLALTSGLSGLLCCGCRDTSILEALPSRLDPAGAGGPVALPAAGATMHGVR